MGMYGELAAECKRRKQERNYVDVIPISLRLNYIDPNGKTRYFEEHFSGGEYTDGYIKKLIRRIESEHNLPLRKKDSNEDS